MELRHADEVEVDADERGDGITPVEDRLRERAVDAIVGSILLDPYGAMAGAPPQQLINASAAYHAKDVEALRSLLPDVTEVARLAVDQLGDEGMAPSAILSEIDPEATIDLRALDGGAGPAFAADAGTEPSTDLAGDVAPGLDPLDPGGLPPGLRPPPPDARPTRASSRWARRLRGHHQA